MYFGFGVISIMFIAGIIIGVQSFQAKELEGSKVSITLSIENELGDGAAYFSVVPAEQFFSEATTINFSNETEPEKKIRCEFACTKQD